MNYTNELHQKNKARGKAAAAVEIPSELDSADFREAWERWEQHRKEIKNADTQHHGRAAPQAGDVGCTTGRGSDRAFD